MATPQGGTDATWMALERGLGRPGQLDGALLDRAFAVAGEALAGTVPDLCLLATTKGDVDRWCAALVDGAHDGGPAGLAAELGARLGCPAFAISAACASGPAALAVAARRFATGDVHRVVVVGADRIGGFIRDGFDVLKARDPDGCHPYDARRAGLALGEAVAAVALTDDTADGIHLAGWGGASDANHLTGPSRDGAGLAAAVTAAVARSGGGRPALVIGHGTGTRYNDDSESLGLARAAPGVPVTGAKGLLGHSLGACGVVEAVLAAECLRRGRAFGTVGLRQPGVAGTIDLLLPGAHPLPAGDGILTVNAGFGGLNHAAFIARQPAPRRPPIPARCATSAALDGDGWRGPAGSGRWQERADGLPRLGSLEITGSSDPTWGRMDLPSRALTMLARLLGPWPEATATVLLTDAGSAAVDRRFDAGRRTGDGADPQRFAYTLPTAAIGEAGIRLGLKGPAFAALGCDDGVGRILAADLIAAGAPAVLLARVEADGALLAWGECWLPGLSASGAGRPA